MNWILADQGLTTYMGHSFEYARAIRDQVRGLGHPATVLASAAVSRQVMDELEAVPCFRYGLDHDFAAGICRYLPRWIGQWFHGVWNYWQHDRTMYRDLVDSVGAAVELPPQSPGVFVGRQYNCRPNRGYNCRPNGGLGLDDLVLFHTIRHNHVVPIVRWAERWGRREGPRLALVFRFTAYPSYARPSATAAFYRRAFARLERSPARERFRLFTDSEALAWEYRDYTSLPLTVLPIPHVEAVSAQNGTSGPATAPSPRPIRLSYLGDARTNKGFHLLPYVFERLEPLCRRNVVAGEVQANARDHSDGQVQSAIRRLRRTAVRLHEEELPSADYYAMLGRADVVLLPYTLDYYHAQTSGIFAEAVARGKPVVVPRGSWMATQMQSRGAGVTFFPEDRLSLFEAVLSAVESHAVLAGQARRRAKAWTDWHNPGSLVDTILRSYASGTP